MIYQHAIIVILCRFHSFGFPTEFAHCKKIPDSTTIQSLDLAQPVCLQLRLDSSTSYLRLKRRRSTALASNYLHWERIIDTKLGIEFKMEDVQIALDNTL